LEPSPPAAASRGGTPDQPARGIPANRVHLIHLWQRILRPPSARAFTPACRSNHNPRTSADERIQQRPTASAGCQPYDPAPTVTACRAERCSAVAAEAHAPFHGTRPSAPGRCARRTGRTIGSRAWPARSAASRPGRCTKTPCTYSSNTAPCTSPLRRTASDVSHIATAANRGPDGPRHRQSTKPHAPIRRVGPGRHDGRASQPHLAWTTPGPAMPGGWTRSFRRAAGRPLNTTPCTYSGKATRGPLGVRTCKVCRRIRPGRCAIHDLQGCEPASRGWRASARHDEGH
jgi:hypothetical protein